jgi:hypothetical protein
MRVIVARSNFFNPRYFSVPFSGNRDAKFHRNLRNAMLGWLLLDAFVPSAANLRNELLIRARYAASFSSAGARNIASHGMRRQ